MPLTLRQAGLDDLGQLVPLFDAYRGFYGQPSEPAVSSGFLRQRIEQVAWSLGASWSYTMRKVVLPNLAPSVFAAWIFAFIGSFDEVIVTSFIAGKYETVPKKMFNELILEVNPTITAVATLLIFFTVLALAAVAFILGRAGKLKQTLV